MGKRTKSYHYRDPKNYFLDRKRKRMFKEFDDEKENKKETSIKVLSSHIFRRYFYSFFSHEKSMGRKLNRGDIYMNVRKCKLNLSVKELMLDIDQYRKEVGHLDEIEKEKQEDIVLYIESIIKSLIREWEINKLQS